MNGVSITPTNSCLGFLGPTRIAKVDREGRICPAINLRRKSSLTWLVMRRDSTPVRSFTCTRPIRPLCLAARISTRGPGYVLIAANGLLDTTLIFVALTWISVIAVLFYGMVALLERPFVHWHVSHRTQTASATP
jgi:hypothetical protein